MMLLLRLAAFIVCCSTLGLAGLAIASLGGRFSGRLDVLTHFAPIYFVGASAGLLLAFVMPPIFRSIAMTSALAAMIASGLLLAPEFASARVTPPPPNGQPDFKIIQFNVWGGNGKAHRAVDWILKQDADLVVLQEGGRIEYELKRRGGYYISCANCHAVILSKAVPLASNTPASWRIEPPFVTVATLADPQGPITVIGLHRHWPNRAALYASEMLELKALVAKYDRRDLIVAGDFNSTPWSFARRREDRDLGLIRRTRALFSWPAEQVSHNRAPAPFPFMPIDHIYAGPGWVTVKTERGPKLGSDHYPVVVTLRRAQPVGAPAEVRG